MAQSRDQQHNKSLDPDKPALARQGVTSRALIIGALGASVIGLGAPYGRHILHGSYMALDHNTPAAVALLFLLVAGPNLLLLRFLKRMALNTAEIIVVYGMMTVASALASEAFNDRLLSVPTGVYYRASPSNKWAETIIPHIPRWLVPSGAAPGAPVITHLYEGMPAGAAVPWNAWLPVLAAWLPFLLCLYIVMICLAVLLRKQWVENEHLIYPANYLPLALAGAHTQGRPAILGQGLFWLGFGSACVVNTLAVLHNWFPTVPYWRPFIIIPAPFLAASHLIVYVNVAMLGFLYLASAEVSFSLFFFNMLKQGILSVLKALGITSTETLLGHGCNDPISCHVTTGAFLALVASGLWIARGHLRTIWERVKGKGGPLDDTEKILPYRIAFWLIVAGLVAMVWWLSASGVPLLALFMLLILSLVNYIGVTRIVAETGLTKVMAPASGGTTAAAWLGWGPLGARGMVALSLSNNMWSYDTRTFVMCQASHTLQMADFVRHNKARLLWALGIGILVAMATSIWLLTTYAYRIGGATMGQWMFADDPQWTNTHVADWIARKPGPSVSGMALSSLGAGIYVILSIMRFRFIGWPFHPIGFAVCGLGDMNWLWFTCLLAWFVKSIALRYGGLKTYQGLRPAFLGLIAGSYTSAAVWLIVDQLTGHTGNRIIMSS